MSGRRPPQGRRLEAAAIVADADAQLPFAADDFHRDQLCFRVLTGIAERFADDSVQLAADDRIRGLGVPLRRYANLGTAARRATARPDQSMSTLPVEPKAAVGCG